MSHFRSDSPPSRAPGESRLHALIAEQLKAYQDNELPGWRHWLVTRHLSHCAECRKEITQLKRVSEEMRNLPQAMPRPELRARILASLPAAPPQRARLTINMPAPAMRFAVACAMCGLLLLSVWALGHSHNPSNESKSAPQNVTQTVKAFAMPSSKVAAQAGSAPPAVGVNTSGDNLASDNNSGNSSVSSNSSVPNISSPNTSAPMTAAALDSRPDQLHYTDPTSRMAEEIMEQKDVMDEVDRKIVRAHREAERRQRLADAAEARARHALEKSGQTSLQLAVVDVAIAHDHLRNIVQSLGGNLTESNQDQSATAHAATGDSPAHPTGDPINTPGTPAPATATVISIRVPASAAGRLQSTLRQMGTVVQWQASTMNFASQAQKRSVMTEGNIPKNQSIVSLHPRYNEYRNDGAPLKMSEAVPTPLPREGNRDMIIFTVRLQAAGNVEH